VCAGSEGEPSLEDTLLAGGFVEYLCDAFHTKLNDSARLAWDCFENQGRMLRGALEISKGGESLRKLGFEDDIHAAAQVDQFTLVPELRRDPLRLERTAAAVAGSYWPK
jgi:phosphosulfolactate phosphohydrolase-like enzyme